MLRLLQPKDDKVFQPLPALWKRFSKLQDRTGRGLLGNSEQVVEATHAKFEKFWLKYVVVDLESDIHGERLLECVIDFNSSNI